MKKQSNMILKAWNAICPILVSFVVTNLAMTVFAMLAAFLGADYETWYMALQTASVAVTIPFIANYYQKDCREPTAFQEHMQAALWKKTLAQKAANGFFMFLAGAVAGLTLNNILALARLEDLSAGYREATRYFYAGGISFELLGACLATPFLEELLYRGVTYGRLCDLLIPGDEEKTGQGKGKEGGCRIVAAALSAALFGAFHMNLVQFVYAGLLGLLLAWFMEKAGHFYGAFLAHAGANLISVLHTETGLLAWMDADRAVFFGATAVSALVLAILIVVIQWVNAEKKQE